ncbi:hypothetical protein FKP32DRAFT_284859 [Trametes sanguinea]|nr:hypothetical protein FKP32DRAFT_284859 [Trametes sanguinea]
MTNSSTGAPFIVHDAQWDPNFYMEYHFRGKRSGERVVVRAEAERFLCARNPHALRNTYREGLVCSLDGPTHSRDQGGSWKFGTNFFHTMYVAMAKPRTASEEPYVKLAPQVDSHARDYMLPREAT